MAIALNEALADMQASRDYFKRHIGGMADAHWDTKPLPHVNSVREIFAHLLATDRAVRAMLHGEPFDIARHGERHKEAGQEIAGLSPDAVLALHDACGQAIADTVRTTFDDVDAPVTLWGSSSKLGLHIGHLSQEMAYHTGQVSLLRQAMEPNWNYFKDVFGVEEG